MSPIIPGAMVANHPDPGQGWFLAVGSFKAYVKLIFFDGAFLTSVSPNPLGPSPSAPSKYKKSTTRRSSTRRLGEASQPIAWWGQQIDRKCPACVKLLSCVGNSVYSEPKLLSSHLGAPTLHPSTMKNVRARGGAVKIFHKKKVIVCPQKTKSETHQRSSTLH